MNAFVVALLWFGFSEKLVFISSGSVRSQFEGDRERHRRSLDEEDLVLLCGDARAFFRGKGLLEKGTSNAQQGETSPVADAELKICATTTTTRDVARRQSSCCTSEMEHQLQVLSFNDMRQVMSSSMTPIRHDLIVAMNSFTDEFRSILRAFENSTFHILANTFRIPTAEVHLLVDKLTSQLIATSSKGQTNDQQLIGKVIADFYDELFIAAVHNLLKFNVSTDSNGEGRRCLTTLRTDTTLMPFGNYPTLFEQHFRRSQGAALMFASGLQLVSDYFNVTVNEDLAEKCLQSVTRMTYCPLCQGLTNTVPCPGKCAWVMRDCRHALMGVSEGIRRFAGEAIDSVQAELSTISSDAVLPSMVSKSLLKVIETGHMYRNQIVKKCGFRKSNGSGSLSSSSVIPSNNVKTLRDGDGLRQTLERLRIILVRTSDLLAALPRTFCNTTTKPSSALISDDRCWNGTSLQSQRAVAEERTDSDESLKDTESASNTYTARLLNEMTSMLQGIHRRPQKAQSKEDAETGAQTTSGKTQRPPRLRPVKYDDAAAAAATDDEEEDDDSDEDIDDQYSGGESGQRAIIADSLTSTVKSIELQTSRILASNNAPLSSSNLILQPTTVTVIISLTTTMLYYACSCKSI